MNIYICSCIEDKYPNIRNSFSLLNLFEPEYIKIFHKDDLYVMCPQIVNFCYQTNKHYFLGKTCAVISRDNLFSCFTALRLGMKSICSTCIRPLSIKLFPHFSKI